MKIYPNLEQVIKEVNNWQDEADQNSQVKSELKQMIGHDLSTPGANIINFTELILHKGSDILTIDEKQDLINLQDLTNKYLQGVYYLDAFALRHSISKKSSHSLIQETFIPTQSFFGAMDYVDVIPKLDSQFDFLANLNLKSHSSFGSYLGIVNSALHKIISSSNTLFAEKKGEYEINQSISNLIKQQQEKLNLKNIKVTCNVAPYFFDYDLANKVVSYLVDNSFEHGFKKSNQNEPDIENEIIIEGELSNLAYRLSVKDNGLGIDKDLFPDINSIFARYKSSRYKEGLSHGDGLDMVYSYIQKQGGFIGADNNEKAGSIFTMILPLNEK